MIRQARRRPEGKGYAGCLGFLLVMFFVSTKAVVAIGWAVRAVAVGAVIVLVLLYRPHRWLLALPVSGVGVILAALAG